MSCFAGVLMGQQHVWTAGSRQQSCYSASAGKGAFRKKYHVFYYPFKHVAVTLTHVHLSMCSSLMVFGFGTCLLVRATPSSWLMETVCSLCCCTVVSSRSQDQHRARGPVKVRGHPIEWRAIQSDPLCCPSAQRFV